MGDPDLGLIDIEAFDSDDGGLDDGLDTTTFPRPEGYRSRADQAAERWRRQREADELADYDRSGTAESTLAKYATNWQIFGGWCHTRGIDPNDAQPDDIRVWIMDLTRQGLRMPTIDGRLAAVRFHFDTAGRPSPTTATAVAKTLDAARNRIGEAKRRARPLMLDDLRRIVAAMPTVLNKPPDHARVLRDRALLTVGWAAALRVSEIVALNVDDVRTFGDPNSGTASAVPSSGSVAPKPTKPVSAPPSDIAIRYASHLNSCPVLATMAWTRKLMDVSNRDPQSRRLPVQTNTGPLFRGIHRSGKVQGRLSRQAVDELIAFYIEHALHDDPQPYSTHSLRAGFVTECSNRGVPETKIRRTTRHISSAASTPTTGPPNTSTTRHSRGSGGDWTCARCPLGQHTTTRRSKRSSDGAERVSVGPQGSGAAHCSAASGSQVLDDCAVAVVVAGQIPCPDA
ncbi:hypothetical protein BH24ACT5_BH24ACT5_02800 [soil metagenome]